ncbi:hypothetical protein BJX76DRAFT_315151 [Aspergillus varians]
MDEMIWQAWQQNRTNSEGTPRVRYTIYPIFLFILFWRYTGNVEMILHVWILSADYYSIQLKHKISIR